MESDNTPPCTVSIGVATVGADAQTLAELFALADARLYMAKESGRDRVVGEAFAASDWHARDPERAAG